ncbi:MAG: hypothetical protein Q9174_003873, partial [Haloplaca sp. 1 TL-2023]
TRLARLAPNLNGGLPRDRTESSFSFQLTNTAKPQWAGVPGWNTPALPPPPPPQQQPAPAPVVAPATNYANSIFPRQDTGIAPLCLRELLLTHLDDDQGIAVEDDAWPPSNCGTPQGSATGSRVGSGGSGAESGMRAPARMPGPPPMPGLVFDGYDVWGEEQWVVPDNDPTPIRTPVRNELPGETVVQIVHQNRLLNLRGAAREAYSKRAYQDRYGG